MCFCLQREEREEYVRLLKFQIFGFVNVVNGNAVLIYVCAVHVCDIARGLKPSHYGEYILYLSSSY